MPAADRCLVQAVVWSICMARVVTVVLSAHSLLDHLWLLPHPREHPTQPQSV